MMRRMFLLAVVCLFAASVAMAAEGEKKGEGKKARGGRFTEAGAWQFLGGEVKDGKPVGDVTKDKFVEKVTKQSEGKKGMDKERAEQMWKRFAGEKATLSAADFSKAYKEMQAKAGKGGKRGEKKADK